MGQFMKLGRYTLSLALALAGTVAAAQMQPQQPGMGQTGPMGQPSGQHIPGMGEPGLGGSGQMPGEQRQQTQTSEKNAPKVDDDTLLRQVHEQLARNNEFNDVRASVNSGVVTLEGTVPRKEDRKEAKQLAEAVPGVRKVHEKLSVRPGGASASLGANAVGTENPETSNNNAGSISANASAASGTEAGTASMGQSGASTSSVPSTNPGTTPGSNAGANSNDVNPPQASTVAPAPISGPPATSATTCPCKTAGTGALGTGPETGQPGSAASGSTTATTATCPCAAPPSEPLGGSGAASSGGIAGSSAAGTGGRVAEPGAAGATASNAATQQPGAAGSQMGTSAGMATPEVGTTLPDNASLQGQIQTAFRHDPSLADDSITANVTDTTIELTGTVSSGKDRQSAKALAESYAGNRKVVDHLTVANK